MSPGSIIASVLLAGSIMAVGLVGLSAARSLVFWSSAADDASVFSEPRGEIGSVLPAEADVAEGRAMPWLPVFGASETVLAEQQGSMAEVAALDFNYALRGVIASGDRRSAILSGPEGDILAHEGDVLEEAEIVAIHAESIEIELGGETRTITFSEDTPVDTARIEPAEPVQSASNGADALAPVARPPAQDVIFQRMSREELLKVLREAEAKRKDRKLPRDSRK